MPLKAIDFFCGIGGVTRGFLNKGIDVVAGIDIDINCKETYEINNIRPNGIPSKFFAEDITQFDLNKLNSFLNEEDKLIVIGCTPCQPFTQITKNLNGRTKERGLLQLFAEIILDLEPEYIFLENVQGLNAPGNKDILQSFVNALKPLYHLNPRVINASHYGVPQVRKRIILFGKRNATISYPLPTHGLNKELKPLKTVKDVIGNLPEIRAGEQHSTLTTHICYSLIEKNIERLTHQSKPGDNMENWPLNLQLPSRLNKQYTGHNDVYSRVWWDRPSSTLTTKFLSISNGRFAHPEQNRGLSILEGLLLQTFPENFKMHSPALRTQARQIGNAVPIKLAEAFAEHILNEELALFNQEFFE